VLFQLIPLQEFFHAHLQVGIGQVLISVWLITQIFVFRCAVAACLSLEEFRADHLCLAPCHPFDIPEVGNLESIFPCRWLMQDVEQVSVFD